MAEELAKLESGPLRSAEDHLPETSDMLKVAQRLLTGQRVVVSSYWKSPLLKEVGEMGGVGGGGRNFQKLSH